MADERTMSAEHIKALPDETLLQIFGYLTDAEKSAMCLVSKKYLPAARDALYGHLTLHVPLAHTGVGKRDKLLFILRALAAHSELLRCIHTFTMEQETDDHTPAPRDSRADAFQTQSDVRDAALRLLDTIPEIDKDLAARLRASVADLSRMPKMDGLMAIILCSAPLLKGVKLLTDVDDKLPLSREVLGRARLCHSDGKHKEGLRNVKYYEIEGPMDPHDQIPVTPTMKEMRLGTCSGGLDGIGPEPIAFPYHDGITTQLHSLSLFRSNLDPDWLEQTVRSGRLANLRVLRVWDACLVQGSSDSAHHTYDFGQLSDAFEKHLPNLEVFEWSRTDVGQATAHRPLGSLSRCTKLYQIQVELDLLVTYRQVGDIDSVPWFTSPKDFLPAGLRQLHISKFRLAYLDRLCSLFNPFHSAAPRTISSRAKLMPALEIICISLDMEDEQGTREMSEDTFAALKFLVMILECSGVHLEIWRQSRWWGRNPLIAPGFTREWPHWCDVNFDAWSPRDHSRYVSDSRFRSMMLHRRKEYLVCLREADTAQDEGENVFEMREYLRVRYAWEWHSASESSDYELPRVFDNYVDGWIDADQRDDGPAVVVVLNPDEIPLDISDDSDQDAPNNDF